jgi:large subunit ribosomal protein L24
MAASRKGSAGRKAPGRTKLKVKKGDTVLVIAGKDKGAKGKVILAYPDSSRVLVEGVNRIKKHTKVSTTQRGAKTGGIVTQEAAIHVSNVMVVGSDGKPSRVGYRAEEVTRDDGRVETKRVRVSRRTGEDI